MTYEDAFQLFDKQFANKSIYVIASHYVIAWLKNNNEGRVKGYHPRLITSGAPNDDFLQKTLKTLFRPSNQYF